MSIPPPPASPPIVLSKRTVSPSTKSRSLSSTVLPSSPPNAYAPHRPMFHSLSAYHCGHGGGTTCFTSFPEYVSGPANASVDASKTPPRAKESFFIRPCFRRRVRPRQLKRDRSGLIKTRIDRLARSI